MSDVQLPAGYMPAGMSIQQVTIASGASASEMINIQGRGLVGIFTPTNGWTDAAIGFKIGWNGRSTDLVNAYNNVMALEQCLVSTDAAAASISIPFPEPDVLFAPFLQLTSVVAAATTAAPQAAARVLTLLFKNYLS